MNATVHSLAGRHRRRILRTSRCLASGPNHAAKRGVASQMKIAENSAEQVKVDMIAWGMGEIIVGDLKQEIVDGSAPAPTGRCLRIVFPQPCQRQTRRPL